MGFEIFMAVSIQTIVFQVVMLCNDVDDHHCSSKVKATSYKTTDSHNTDDHNLNSYSFNSTTYMEVSKIRNILQVIRKRINKTYVLMKFSEQYGTE
jgi:hypothetical protein